MSLTQFLLYARLQMREASFWLETRGNHHRSTRQNHQPTLRLWSVPFALSARRFIGYPIRDENEFLMNLNRFNVMATRARAKLVVLVSQQVVDHLPNDLDTLCKSRLLKVCAESFCGNASHPSLAQLVLRLSQRHRLRSARSGNRGECPRIARPAFANEQRLRRLSGVV